METIIQLAISAASNFKMLTEHNITFFVCEPLERGGFKNAFSTRSGGVSPFPSDALSLGVVGTDDPKNVTENRRRYLHALNADKRTIVTGTQVHSAELRVVKSEFELSNKTPKCDGVVANLSGILAGVFSADCTPVLIGDPVTGAFAAVHAGWRGTMSRIVEKAVATLAEEFGTESKNCIAAIGPAAGGCCYEVGPEVLEQFRQSFDYADQLFSNHRGDKANLDVVSANVFQLLSSGIGMNNIYTSGLCTMCRPDLFFSYRMDKAKGPVGLLLSVIGRQ